MLQKDIKDGTTTNNDKMMMQGTSNLCGRFSLMTSIIPREGSMRIYKVLIIAITTISQLDGLAG